MKLFEEELLEPIARHYRFKKGLGELKKIKKPVTIIDLGCGPKIRFYHFAKKNGIKIKAYIGVDPLLDKNVIKTYEENKDITLIKASFENKIPLKDGTADCIVGFAFLEHVDDPKKVINNLFRLLKTPGTAIFTAPTPKAKSILEFLSFKLGLISRREIEEHKNYLDNKTFPMLVPKNKTLKATHTYFEFGLNNLLVIKKSKIA